jgi:hypothetical protein
MSTNEEHLQSDEDVEAILRLAVSRTGSGPGDLRARLVQSAAELGVPPDVLAEAEESYRLQRAKESAEARERADFQKFRRAQWAGFVQHLIPYCLVNGLFVLTDLSQSPQIDWARGPLLGWGIGLAFHFFFTLFPGDQTKEFERWRKKTLKRGD